MTSGSRCARVRICLRLFAVAALLPVLATACDLEAGGQVSFLTYDGDPDWSPDGHSVAFVSSRGDGGIYVLGDDGKDLRLIMRGDANELDWSPDGRMLAFVRDDGIYVIKATGGKPRRLLADYETETILGKVTRTPLVSSPTWAPDGKKLAYVKMLPDFSSAIHVIGRDGHGARRLLPRFRGSVGDAGPGSPSAVSEREPAWSPDGKQIAFQAGDGQLAVARVDDGRRRILTERGSYEPAWSSDGKSIAYQCEGDLCVINVQSGESNRLATDGGDPSWAPDSRRIVFEHYLYSTEAGPLTGDAQSLTLIDAVSGDSEKLTYGPDVPPTP